MDFFKYVVAIRMCQNKKIGSTNSRDRPLGMRCTLGSSWIFLQFDFTVVTTCSPFYHVPCSATSRFRYNTVFEKILFHYSRHFHNSQSHYHSSSPICKINEHMFQGSPGWPCSRGPARSPVGHKWQPTDHVNLSIMRYFCVFICNWIKKSRRRRENNVTLKLWRVREGDKPL